MDYYEVLQLMCHILIVDSTDAGVVWAGSSLYFIMICGTNEVTDRGGLIEILGIDHILMIKSRACNWLGYSCRENWIILCFYLRKKMMYFYLRACWKVYQVADVLQNSVQHGF